MAVEHESNFGEPAVELGSESWKLGHQPLMIEPPHRLAAVSSCVYRKP
jgi:hypothetical protein